MIIPTAGLLLIILLPFNAAGGEKAPVISDVLARVGAARFIENVVISHADEQETIASAGDNVVHLGLIARVAPYGKALLFGPNGRCSGQGGFYTFCKGGFFDLIFDGSSTADSG